MRNLYLIRGLPGSGKTTLAYELSDVWGASHYEADDFFIDDNGIYRYNKELIGAAHAHCIAMAGTAMLNNQPDIIVSNTFTTLKEMEVYFQLAKKHGYIVSVILMQSEFISTHNVPAATLEKMKGRFEYDVSPLYAKYREI